MLDSSHSRRVRFIELHDGVSSPAGPFQLGIASSDAPWLSILGSDDYLEPGAIRTWLNLSRRADAVITRVHYDDDATMRTPPVRPLMPRRFRDAVKDRLYYRSAPIGLIRNAYVRSCGLTLTPELSSGVDLAMSTLLWSHGRTVVQRRGPGYRVGQDADDRVTMSLIPLADQLSYVERTWCGGVTEGLSTSQRTELGTKYLRIHFFGAAHYRAEAKRWLAGDREALAENIRWVLARAPGCEEPLSRADQNLLDALLDLSVSDQRVDELSKKRRKFGSLSTLFPRNLSYSLNREAPLRFMAASLAVP